MHHHTELSFVDEFRWVSPFTTYNTDDRTLFFFGACCQRGRHLYTTTVPSCCIPASYCHLSATLQTMSIIVVNLQENRAVFRIFIALLKFSIDCLSHVSIRIIICQTENFAILEVSFQSRSIWFGRILMCFTTTPFIQMMMVFWRHHAICGGGGFFRSFGGIGCLPIISKSR